MTKEKQTTKSTAVTTKAYEIASSVVKKRRESGLSSSITAVISEAVNNEFRSKKG